MRIARPAVEERVGAEADRRIGVVDQRRHHPVVQRGRVVERPHAGDQRQDRAAGQTEGVEHRHRVEHDVGRGEIDHRGGLSAVGEQVAMAQHHALRRALGAAGEQHHRRRVGRTGEAAQTPRAAPHPASRAAAPPARYRRGGPRATGSRPPPPSPPPAGPRRARSTKRREDRTRRTSASRQARSIPSAPAVTFSTAGTRPNACSAMKLTALAAAFGSSRPIASPGRLRPARARPRTQAPSTIRR